MVKGYHAGRMHARARAGGPEPISRPAARARDPDCHRGRLMPPPAALGRLKRAATTTPNPYPFLLLLFILLWGKATGRTGGAPLRPCRGARDGAVPGPGRGKINLVRCATPQTMEARGWVQARRSARASATSAGGRADPHGQGERGRGIMPAPAPGSPDLVGRAPPT